MISNNRLCNCSANGVYLCSGSPALDADANVQVAKLVLSNNEYGLEDLQSERLRLNELNRLAVYLDQATALLGEGDRSGVLLSVG